MQQKLKGKKIAFLATDEFEQVELTRPWEDIQNAGAMVELVSLKTGEIQGMNHADKADTFSVDKTVDEVISTEYDGLVLPGGVQNPDALRLNQRAVLFVKEFSNRKNRLQPSVTVHGHWPRPEF